MDNETSNICVNKKSAKVYLEGHFAKYIVPSMLFAYFIYFSTVMQNYNRLTELRNMTDLNKCPACYGVSACSAVYSGHIKTYSCFNASQPTNDAVFVITNEKLLLKKLADKKKLQQFDDKLCEEFGLQRYCKTTDLYKKFELETVKAKIKRSVHWNFSAPEYDASRHLVFCPYLSGLDDFLEPILGKKASLNKSRLINVWTMLKINVEPIILARMADPEEWPIPQYGGCCGRLEVVSQTGVPLSHLKNLSLEQKLNITSSLIDAAVKLTFNDQRYRYYMMDWSKDNILVSSDHRVTFASYDKVVVLDTSKDYAPSQKELHLWYTRYHRRNHSTEFSRSGEHVYNLCSSHLSDHNFWELCYLVTGGDEPFLIIDADKTLQDPFIKLLDNCKNEESDKFTLMSNILYNRLL